MPKEPKFNPPENAQWLNSLLIAVGDKVADIRNATFLEKPARAEAAMERLEDVLRGTISVINLQGAEIAELRKQIDALTPFADEVADHG